jgi:ABC-type microcin C transport system permease subunit YejB
MAAYLLRRLLLVIPTLFGIIADQFRRGAIRPRRAG